MTEHVDQIIDGIYKVEKDMPGMSDIFTVYFIKDRYSVILANPPFGAGIGREIQQNFPIKTGETAFLFLQHFIKILKAGGRAGVVIKNTFLSTTDNEQRSFWNFLQNSFKGFH